MTQDFFCFGDVPHLKLLLFPPRLSSASIAYFILPFLQCLHLFSPAASQTDGDVLSTFSRCPGFSQDRVSFHKKPGGDTARMADPNWPNKRGIGHHELSCSVLRGRGV